MPKRGVEPLTRGFSDRRSTTELLRRIGAGRENRTPVISLATRNSTTELCPHEMVCEAGLEPAKDKASAFTVRARCR